MCKINCSGGCPECSPEYHLPSCTHQYMPGISNCTCGDAWKSTVFGSLPPGASDYELMKQREERIKNLGNQIIGILKDVSAKLTELDKKHKKATKNNGIKTPRGSRRLP